MALRLKGYDAMPRLAYVVNSDECGSIASEYVDHECIAIGDGRAVLVRAQTSFDAAESSRKQSLSLEEGDIVSINANGLVHKIYDYREHNATVFITGKCNSNCIMCPCSDRQRMTNDGMPDGLLREFIDMLPEDTPHIVVTGGEPTLNVNRFILSMRQIAKRLPNSEVLLLSNGRSLASKRLLHDLLELCPPHLTVGIPLHGDGARLHDAVTRVVGSFNQTVGGIRNLLGSGIAVELRVVVTRLNVDRLLQIANLILADFPQVQSVKFMGLETLGNCIKNFDSVYISHSESWPSILPAIIALMSGGIPVEIYNYPLCAVDKGFWFLCRKSITPSKVRFPIQCERCDWKDRCGGFFASTLVKANPKVYPIRPTRS